MDEEERDYIMTLLNRNKAPALAQGTPQGRRTGTAGDVDLEAGKVATRETLRDGVGHTLRDTLRVGRNTLRDAMPSTPNIRVDDGFKRRWWFVQGLDGEVC